MAQPPCAPEAAAEPGAGSSVMLLGVNVGVGQSRLNLNDKHVVIQLHLLEVQHAAEKLPGTPRSCLQADELALCEAASRRPL
eukprot:CAMPEP_0197924204 /NCGR_PEP_ID=MMETSP1439-20131203/95306_1 /TAXON_ID=66791 /ORGANISM="Gonyaulax spinifera, Strain CCMP409" /LENGTH=81 /DNA_ID=CAMNT_0043546617 /DNA_START=151 /DNA_END=392 /DNA_ORIENTATION=-